VARHEAFRSPASTLRSTTSDASPISSPQTIVTARVVATAAPPIAISASLGIQVGSIDRRAPTIAQASTRPVAPPAKAISNDSVSSSRASRPRPAPRAARTDSSSCRALARATTRFAVLLMAIRRISPVAPSRTISVGRTGATNASIRKTATGSDGWPIASSSCWACASVVPSLRWPSRDGNAAPSNRGPSLQAAMPSTVANRGPDTGSATPTTVWRASPRRIVRPSTSGSAPKRLVQVWCASTTTGAASGRKSPSCSSRPSAGHIPTRSVKPAVARRTRNHRSRSPSSGTVCPLDAAIASNVDDDAFQSSKSGTAAGSRPPMTRFEDMRTRRAASGYGQRSSTL